MKLRLKCTGKIIEAKEMPNGTYLDDSNPSEIKEYHTSDIDFDFMKSKWHEHVQVGEIIHGDYNEDRCFGLTPIPPRNFKFNISNPTNIVGFEEDIPQPEFVSKSDF